MYPGNFDIRRFLESREKYVRNLDGISININKINIHVVEIDVLTG